MNQEQDAALTTEICRQYLVLNDSKTAATPEINQQKKRCKEAIIELLERNNATYMQVQDQQGLSKYIVKYGKQKMHSMSDMPFLTFAVSAWCASELKYNLSESQKKHFQKFLKNSQSEISQRKYPILVPYIKVENDLPFHAYPTNMFERSAGG